MSNKQLMFLVVGLILGWMTLTTSMARQLDDSFRLQQKHVDKAISLLEKIERNTR